VSALDEVLARLKILPEDEKRQFIAGATAQTRDMVWVPNPGPQEIAFFSDADETFYGGQAGGGKTDLAVGLAVTVHRRSLILRRINKDAVKIVSRIEEVLGTRNGYNGQLQRWRINDKQIDIAGCEQESDKQRFKGDPHDLICVQAGTPVLLADGNYCAVENLRVGQMLQTLEGPRRLERRYPAQRKACVEVVAFDASGREIGRQVQSTSHRLLTSQGWTSADDRAGACEPTGYRDACTPEQLLLATYAETSQHRGLIGRGLPQTGGWLRRFQETVSGWATRVSCLLSVRETYSARSDGRSLSLPPLPLWSALGARQRLGFQKSSPFAQPLGDKCAIGGVRASSSPAGWRDRYSSDTHQHDARTPTPSGLSTVVGAGLQWLLQRAGVGLPSPSRSPVGATGGTQTRSLPSGTYAHPYTKETRQYDPACSVQSVAFSVAPIGEKVVYDLQVAEVRHYITKGGFVNQNCFDEGTDFLESQYRFIIGWNRSAVPGQRCRVLVTSNPPTTAEGLWVIKYWAPWLDDTHPNPAAPGELRWFTTIGGEDVEVDGPGPHMVDGEEITARSRTFIPAALADNPDLAATNYASVLASLPEELRRAYRDGDFSVGLKDADFQVIPTDWIKAAQARWTPRPPEGVMMTAMGFDPAGGGSDAAELAYRYGGWYGPLITATGADTADGSSMAATVMKHRRDACPVVVDMGGGYGGAVTMRLADNKVEFVKFNGATGSSARTKDGSLAFVNKRAEAYWRFREELDPDQPGGSVIALPPDPELRADLAAPTWSLKPNGIVLESKEEIRKRLGRSPGKADAVVYALDAGQQAVKRQQKRGAFGQHPKVTLGYGHMKQNYGR
jgi:hypothetical protein